MENQRNSIAAPVRRSALAGVVIAALMLVVGAPRVRADNDMEKCRHDTEKAEAKLDRAITEHGEHSHEASEKMEDLRKQRERCYEHLHQWWDGRDQSWHHNDDFGDDLHHRGDHDRDHDHPDSK